MPIAGLKSGAVMDVREFVEKQEASLKRYRMIYKLLDFAAITIVFYFLLFYLNVDRVFPLLNSFEVKAGTSYNVLGISIAFETVALTLIAAFVALLLTLTLHLRDKKTKALFMIENIYPDLRERLRTAYDNASIDNLVVADLLHSVSLKIKSIDPSALFIKKRVVFGLILILLSSAMLVYVVHNDVRTGLVSPEDMAGLIDGRNNDGSEELLEFSDENSNITSSGTENLTGEIAIIVVDGTPVDLTLPPGTGVGFEDSGDSNESDTGFDKSSPYEISVITSQAYYEQLPEGYESVIKSYFEEMAQS
ncbi:hypothetical protein [Methanolobus sp.]|jgi:hypothetical protein|uniref:DUF7502 family protein n=1 Tax=Methanolobus sp. TaxID=1874737 RepID=UPI0025F94A81|nr:hypothetical protein [Methanolobus sp.]